MTKPIIAVSVALQIIVAHSALTQNFWQPAGLDSLAASVLAIDSVGNIFAGTDSGLFHSTNDGNSWIRTGLTNTNCYDLAISPSNEIYAAAFGGSFSSTGSIYRSTDYGTTWSEVLDSLWLTARLATNSSNHIFAGIVASRGDAIGIFRSLDHGQSWTNIAVGASVSDFAINSNGVIFLAGVIAIAPNAQGIYRSTDNGNSWHLLLSVSGMGYPSSFAFNALNHVFWTGDSILRSTDNGGSWTPLSLTSPVVALAINLSGHIFAAKPVGNAIGVFRSTNNGLSWNSINTGLTNPNVWSLAINPNGYIFAGTKGGVFRSVQSTTSVDEVANKIPTSFSLEQNYPNPFNPSTTIRFQIAEVGGQRSEIGVVTLKVYNLLGQEVATLVNEKLRSGSYEVTWEPVGLASGVYFYRLDVRSLDPAGGRKGSFTETKKLILLR